MAPELIAGLSGVVGAAIGGLFSYLSARTGHNWQEAKSDIRKLADQVSAYHKLEELYKERLAALDPSLGAPVTVQKLIRSQVADIDGFERPEMSANQARRIQQRWS